MRNSNYKFIAILSLISTSILASCSAGTPNTPAPQPIPQAKTNPSVSPSSQQSYSGKVDTTTKAS